MPGALDSRVSTTASCAPRFKRRPPPSFRFILPLRIALMAAPSRTLHGHRQAQACAPVGDETVQLLEVHIQRSALGTARLLVQADALHVKTFENRFVENLASVLHIRDAHIEFDAATS